MTEVVGTGVKSAEDMTRDQATEAMQRILAGEPDHTTLGAFWLANRWKHNNAEELAAYADVMSEERRDSYAEADPVDCGANYDGKGRSAILGVGAGVVAAAAGTPVVVHSGDRVPTQKQDAYKHVLTNLASEPNSRRTKVPTWSTRSASATTTSPSSTPASTPCASAATTWASGRSSTPSRRLRTPPRPVHLGSFYHLAFAKKVVDTFEQSETSSVERALFFQGMEGYDDVRPGETIVAEWPVTGEESDDEDIADFEIRTGEYGMDLRARTCRSTTWPKSRQR